MKTYEISRIGEYHLNHNEDSSLIAEIGENKIMIAVMDGCSGGKESHFVSTLITKLLRKIGREFGLKKFAEKAQKKPNECLEEILKKLFENLKQLKNQLQLETLEMLSTIILGILDTERKEAEVIVIGDGLICCNEQLTEYDQDNMPNYLGYHLGEPFEDWFQQQTQKLSLKEVEDLSISTDGIFSFRNFKEGEYESITKDEIVDYFLIDEQGKATEYMLKNKFSVIVKEFGLTPGDDLTIIRVILNEDE